MEKEIFTSSRHGIEFTEAVRFLKKFSVDFVEKIGKGGEATIQVRGNVTFAIYANEQAFMDGKSPVDEDVKNFDIQNLIELDPLVAEIKKLILNK